MQEQADPDPTHTETLVRPPLYQSPQAKFRAVKAEQRRRRQASERLARSRLTDPEGHKPMSRQRSPWERVQDDHPELAVFHWRTYRRRVSDGFLVAMTAVEPGVGWHLSVSFRRPNGDLSRYPRWDEIVDARDQLTPPTVAFAMMLPLAEEFVSLHATTFHLHQHPEPTDDQPAVSDWVPEFLHPQLLTTVLREPMVCPTFEDTNTTPSGID